MNKLSNAKHNETNRKLMIAQNRNRESEILLGLLSLTFIVFVLIFAIGVFNPFNNFFYKTSNTLSASTTSSSAQLLNSQTLLNASDYPYLYGLGIYSIQASDGINTASLYFGFYNTSDALTSENALFSNQSLQGGTWTGAGYVFSNISAYTKQMNNQYQNETKELFYGAINSQGYQHQVNSTIFYIGSKKPISNYYIGSITYNLSSSQEIWLVEMSAYQSGSTALPSFPTTLNCSSLTQTYVSSLAIGANGGRTEIYECKVASGYTYSYISDVSLEPYSTLFIANASAQIAVYNFSSSFSYISPIGSTPYCSYSYGYLPNFYFDGSLVNPIPTPTYYTDKYSYLNFYESNISNGNSAFNYYNLNVYPASTSNFTFPYASIEMSGNNTYALKNSLFYIYDEISKSFSFGSPTTSSQITLPNGVQYTEYPSTLAIFGWYPNSTNNADLVDSFLPIAVSNINKSLNETASMNLTLDIPLNISLPTDVNESNIQIKNVQLYLDAESNSTKVKFVQLDGRLVNGYLVPINFKHLLVVSSTDKAPAQFLLSTTINLTLEENTTGLTSGYTYARTGLYMPNGESVVINISYNSGFYVYTYKTYSSLPSKANISFVGSNGIILTNSQKSSYSYTTNLSNGYYIPSANLFWTYSTSASYTLEFSTYLNNQLWTSNSKVFYNGINYSIGSNGYINIPDVPANTGITYTTIYHYNTENLLVSGSLTTPSFNPCNPILTYQYTNLASVYVNGSVVGTTKTSNGSITSTGTSQSTLKSSITSTLFTGVSTAFGESFLNVGTFSFVLTSGFLYLVVGLALFGLIEYYFKKKSIYGVIFFAVYVLIGALTQLIPAFLSVIVILTLSVIIALNFKKML